MKKLFKNLNINKMSYRKNGQKVLSNKLKNNKNIDYIRKMYIFLVKIEMHI